MTLSRVRIMSPNYSSRSGSTVRLIVLHTAEGARTYQSLGSFFANPASGVSSHVGIDDTPNVIGEYVDRGNKAWTAANANPIAVQAEMCAFAAWSPYEWSTHQQMLKNCAAWIAEEAKAFGIPLVKLSPQQAQSNGRGICQHIDLGAWGGGHVDCGPAFPIDQVIEMAKGGSAPDIEEDDMLLIKKSNGEYSTFNGVQKLRVSGPADLTALKNAGVKEVVGSSDAWYDSIPVSK